MNNNLIGRKTINIKCSNKCPKDCPGHNVVAFIGTEEEPDKVVFDFYSNDGYYQKTVKLDLEEWQAMVEAFKSIE